MENELEEGAWQTVPAKPEFIFYDGTDLWEKVRRDIASTALQSILKIKHVPEDPSTN